MHVEQGPDARAYLQANRQEPNFDELLAIGAPNTARPRSAYMSTSLIIPCSERFCSCFYYLGQISNFFDTMTWWCDVR